MPSSAAPTLYAIVFELGVYAVALIVLTVLWRAKRRSEIAMMVAAMAFADTRFERDSTSTARSGANGHQPVGLSAGSRSREMKPTSGPRTATTTRAS